MHNTSLRKWLANISITKKLYFVVITMVILITFEVLALWFAIGSLSAIRAYVNGEGLWAKAQKDATYHLSKYGFTHNQKDYQLFLAFLKVNLGDQKARLELKKPEPDYALVTQGFLEGRIHSQDIDGVIKLYLRFNKISYMDKAISIWAEADLKIAQLQMIGLKLHKMLHSPQISQRNINKTLIEIDVLNNKLTKLEDAFSFTLGEASRWMAQLLLKVLLALALSIEISALMLTVLFTRRISKGIAEINVAARNISDGDFDAKVPVNSNDEIGYLASTFNQMTAYLKQTIVERKKSEQSLAESEELFKNVFDNAPNGLSLVSMAGKFLRVNKRLCSITGYSERELLKKSFDEITYHEDKDIGWNVIATLMSTNVSTINIEKRYLNKAGHIIWVRLHSSLRRNLEDEPLYFITQTEEITEHKKTEIKIREQAALLDNAQDAIIVRSLDYTITYWNKSAERLYGWKESEVINKKITDLYTEKITDHVEEQNRLLDKGEWHGELTQFTKFGNKIIVQSRCTLILDKSNIPKSVLIVNTDITEKKKLEKQFYRSQRLESIGTLTAGIAHDLNNIFTPIMISIHLLRMDLPEKKRLDVISTLEETSQRGVDIIKQLLIFGRGEKGKKVALQLNPLISQIVSIIGKTFPRTITIEKDLPDSLWFVLGDSTQLQQIILNLCVNARDAMPNGGFLKIVSKNIIIDENYIQVKPEAKMGFYVCMEISDNSIGMSPEIINNIFEPFFTTKETGKGSGLGLSIIIGIVKNHGGFVSVDSQLSKGSQFKIFIPAIKPKKSSSQFDTH